jgi:hypothetical protein
MSTKPSQPPAPLQLDVNEQIECAQTLASRFYTDPSILETEKARIFRRTWQLVGTLNHACGEVNGVNRTIADPESFFTADVAGEPIVIVRDRRAPCAPSAMCVGTAPAPSRWAAAARMYCGAHTTAGRIPWTGD